MVTFTSLGGAREIGANCYYLCINGRGILIDSGMHPKKEDLDALPEYVLLKYKSVDSCIISHAHLDHIGSLPMTLKYFPHLRPFMTHPTYSLSEIMLNNSASIIEKESPGLSPYYNSQLVDMALHTFMPRGFNKVFDLIPSQYGKEDKITCEFYPAGHTLGAASALIKTNNLKIYYTGDINLSSQETLAGARLPDESVDILILESTLASSDESDFVSRSKLVNSFAKNIEQVIMNNGSILIPVFALGKTQEILMTLWQLMNNNKIPYSDIYTGHMSRKITKLYDVYRYMSRDKNIDFDIKDIPQKSFPDKTSKGDFFNKPSILLAPSGMVNKDTVSFGLSKEFLGRFNYAIFFVGYLDPDTPGYSISRLKEGGYYKFNEKVPAVKRKCLTKSFRFTSHSKISELLKIVKSLNPKKVLLIHGDFTGQSKLKSMIEKYDNNIKVILPKDGVEYDLGL